ncbi:LexA family protein [Zhihengliuella halotolerans]|uniref:SOS response UmuD protein n=1 Tax=Zhihengliuella halotolerans TaxID=370736 RepID=A0A4V2G9I5_9MICC|nr:translesion error-prone DNA polymerase V autoproteolytic subunit [Zhihengliuella halotolerans]RZU60496.1 SOS response UmuD protein [Zhihengliuella halotolerans]
MTESIDGAESAGVLRPRPATGFASPAGDYYDGGIDLNRHLIPDRTSTFVMRVSGHSMAGAGAADGDELIVERARAPRDGNVVVAVLDGELVVRRLRIEAAGPVLQTEPLPPSPPVRTRVDGELDVWGVVTRSLHRL